MKKPSKFQDDKRQVDENRTDWW